MAKKRAEKRTTKRAQKKTDRSLGRTSGTKRGTRSTTLAPGDDVRTCFVIMPFRTKADPARKDKLNFDAVYENIIKRGVLSLEEDGVHITCERSDKIERAGLVHEGMIQRIADADVAVVDITSLNANVFYELGIRHALRDRVTVLMRRKGTSNPFNIAGMMTIEYDEKQPEPAKEALRNFIRNGLISAAKDSLVYAVLPGLTASRAPVEIPNTDVEEYRVPGTRSKIIGIVTGQLRHTNLNAKLEGRPIDVWVNSENVNMQMARPYEQSVSGLIRYLGAHKDETGTIVDDVIAKALRSRMPRGRVVNPGNVLPTDAGRLTETHKVKRIFHVASVYGVVGTGYHPIANVEQCVTNALARMDVEASRPVAKRQPRRRRGTPGPTTHQPASDRESILFPLLGTGAGRADIIYGARKQLQAALSYLRSRERVTSVKRVYFLALTKAHLAGLRVALAELGVMRRRRA